MTLGQANNNDTHNAANGNGKSPATTTTQIAANGNHATSTTNGGLIHHSLQKDNVNDIVVVDNATLEMATNNAATISSNKANDATTTTMQISSKQVSNVMNTNYWSVEKLLITLLWV